MLLRCVAIAPTHEQLKELGETWGLSETLHMTPGDEYVALGLEFWKGVLWVDIAENDRTVVSAPLFLFEIIDGQLSRHWDARREQNGALRLWPQLFFERAFHDRLSNGDPQLVAQFEALRMEIEAEAR
jgi:hypothetical protein